MYLNADQLPSGVTLTGFDICIVGAGAAGIALATRLIGSSLKVLVVSSGGAFDTGQSPSPNPALESIYQGVLGPFMQKVDPIFLTRSRLNMYGGTTNHFWFWARPLDDADLKSRPGYRDAYWPLTMDELNRYYPDANTFGDYGPFNYNDIDFWANALNGEPFQAMSGDQLRNGIYHAQPNNNIHQFQVHYGAQLNAAENVTVLFNASVLEIESTLAKDCVTGLRCSSVKDGKPYQPLGIKAGAYVLAQGGIETVRLLKLSGDLGNNAKGLLGKGFMLHPVITSAAQVTFSRSVSMKIQNFFRIQYVTITPPPQQNKAGTYTSLKTHVFHPGDLPPQSLTFQAWGVLSPTDVAMATERIGNFRAIIGFVSDTKAIINMNWEQVCNEESTITLDASQTDPVFGQPVVNLDWNMLEQEKRTIKTGLRLIEEYMNARGASGFKILTDLSGGPEHWTFTSSNSSTGLQAGDHHMGAFRMSASPEDGIVDPNLKVHNVGNLYLSGCGVFPTAGTANPTLTIVALALRLGDHLNGLKAT